MNASCEGISNASFDHRQYRGRLITSSFVKGNRIVFTVVGLAPLVHTIQSDTELLRRGKLEDLLLPVKEIVVSSRPYPMLWTIRDICLALKIPYTSRWRGQIGKDLKALGMYRRHHVAQLMDTRTGKRIPPCDLFSTVPLRIDGIRRTLASLRFQYRSEAKDRLAACQQMRSRG